MKLSFGRLAVLPFAAVIASCDIMAPLERIALP